MLTRRLTVLALTLVLSGCAGKGYEVVRVVDHQALASAHPDNLVGKTEAEVIEKLGTPDFRNKNPEGGVILVYRDTATSASYSRSNPIGSSRLDEHGRPVLESGPALPDVVQEVDSVRDLRVWIGLDGKVVRSERAKRQAVERGTRPSGN